MPKSTEARKMFAEIIILRNYYSFPFTCIRTKEDIMNRICESNDFLSQRPAIEQFPKRGLEEAWKEIYMISQIFSTSRQ